ncbi:MAG: aminomethyl-transferring glycine dehydrogenase subunit GcvPB [Elusimicrobiota bacterium]
MSNKLIFQHHSKPNAYMIHLLENEEREVKKNVNSKFLRSEKSGINIPSVAEIDVVRHFTNLSKKVFGVDNGIYPLGSCTMKYNPKMNEKAAANPKFTKMHPYSGESNAQGILKIIFELQNFLAEISGMDAVSLQPAAGAHGEFTGLLIINAYHKSRNDNKRNKIIIPTSAHGTNPASAALLGMQVIEVRCNDKGNVDLVHLESLLDDTVSAVMITNPSTFGLFDNGITKIQAMAHNQGALLYYDGANLNPMLGRIRPGDMGFDVMHFNLHKTFSTPHGGGGPGSGPIGVKKDLVKFLPLPRVIKKENEFSLQLESDSSIGRVRAFYGNIPAIIRAYVYIRQLGESGLKDVGAVSVLNANYLLQKLKKIFDYPFDNEPCMHEFVLTAKKFAKNGIRALDIAKRMIDYGIHPPTIYFPTTIPECMMFEPTETESRESLDSLIVIMQKIADEIETDPDKLKKAPHTTPVGRLDEVKAVKLQDLAY